jgi:hypothetical protein
MLTAGPRRFLTGMNTTSMYTNCLKGSYTVQYPWIACYTPWWAISQPAPAQVSPKLQLFGQPQFSSGGFAPHTAEAAMPGSVLRKDRKTALDIISHLCGNS